MCNASHQGCAPWNATLKTAQHTIHPHSEPLRAGPPGAMQMCHADVQCRRAVQVIGLCEDLAGAKAKVTNVPVWLLRGARGFLNSFQWARDAADRLVGAICTATPNQIKP